METTTCVHKENIESIGGGIQRGTCSICHQVREYDNNEGAKSRIIKLGRINGVLVLPGPGNIMQLPVEEGKELQVARKESEGVPVEKSPDVPMQSPEVKHQRGIRKWLTRCRSCVFGYTHDEILWCSSKRCSQRCPKKLRPPYRPKEEGNIELSLPETPEGRKQWYQDNKKAMIEDLLTMDNASFLSNWNVESQIISHLKSDPLYLERAKGRTVSKQSKADNLPVFPPFNELWGDSAKVGWFEAYCKLKEMEVKQ